MNRYTRTLALAGATALLPVVALAAPAHAAEVTIRGGAAEGPGDPQGDVVENRNLENGSWEFLRDGIAMSAPGGQDRAGVYWKTRTQEFPDSVALSWRGTQAVDGVSAQPAVVIYVDVDGAGPTPRDALLHEDIYGENDLWLTGVDGGSAAAKSVAPSGGEASGSGSLYAGPAAEWKANLAELKAGEFPDLTIVQAGVNLSGVSDSVKSEGLLRSVTLGEDVYTFTNEEAPVQPPVVTPTDVNGSVAADRTNTSIDLTFTSGAQPENTSVRNKLRWRVAVDNRTAATIVQGFDETDSFSQTFRRGSGAHTVKVFKNGELVRSFVIRTNR